MHKKILCLDLILCLFLYGCGKEPQPYNVHLSFAADTQQEMTVTWQLAGEVNNCTITLVSQDKQHESHYKVQGKIIDQFTVFNYTFQNLESDNKYIYRIGSFEGEFTTAAANGGFCCLFLGDSQASEAVELSAAVQYADWGKRLHEQVEKTEADFVLIAGDLINQATDFEEWNNFFAESSKTFACYPLISAMGNHDNSQEYRELMNYPMGPGGMEDEYFSFEYQNVHFTVINTNNIVNDKAVSWLEKDLSNSDAKFKLVLMHHPPYSAANTPRDEERAGNLRAAFEKIFLENGVDLVLMGHEHLYMRTYPMAQGQIDLKNGIIYLMGVSGAKTYETTENTYSVFALTGECVYTAINVNDKYLKVDTFNSQDEVIDEFVIE